MVYFRNLICLNKKIFYLPCSAVNSLDSSSMFSTHKLNHFLNKIEQIVVYYFYEFISILLRKINSTLLSPPIGVTKMRLNTYINLNFFQRVNIKQISYQCWNFLFFSWTFCKCNIRSEFQGRPIFTLNSKGLDQIYFGFIICNEING